jgi:hypothetical protein
LLGGQRLLASGGRKKGNIKSGRCQTHQGGPGDGDLFESALRSTGIALQYPCLPQKVPPKIVVGNGVGAGDLKKTKATNIPFWPIMYLTFPSFQNTPYHWINFFSSHGFFHLAQNKRVLWPVLRYCAVYTVARQGNQMHIHLQLPGRQFDRCSCRVEGSRRMKIGQCSVLRSSGPRQHVGQIGDVAGHSIPDPITGY